MGWSNTPLPPQKKCKKCAEEKKCNFSSRLLLMETNVVWYFLAVPMQLHFATPRSNVTQCHAIIFQSITHKKDGAVTQVAIDFVSYGTKASGDRSGAYLFMPNGPAEVCFLVFLLLMIRMGNSLSAA